jgi:D-aspartate ligase
VNYNAPVVVVYRGGHGALGVARTLGRLGVPVYLIAQEGMATPVWSSRYWAGRTRWDFSVPAADSVRFLLDFGRDLEERHGARPIVLTLADWIAIFIEEHAEALSERYTFPRAKTKVVRDLANKWQMFLLARESGIPVPETIWPESRAEVTDFLEIARFPIVMKAADPSLEHVPAMAIVNKPDELLAKFDRDSALGPPNLILQEFIPGDAETVWMCNAYFGRESQCHAIFAGRKLRQVSATGIASLAVCSPNETVENQTRAFMQAVGYQGCVGIGWRFDVRDGLYKVLDVNPRVSGVFRLFRATNGMDVVRICYSDLTGQPIPATRPSVGRKWLLEDDLFVAITGLRRGTLTLSQWLRSLRGVREAQWFAIDDPKPILVWLSSRLSLKLRTKRPAGQSAGRRPRTSS